MQIIIEVKNPGVINRLLEMLRQAEWLGGIRIWRKADNHIDTELLYDNAPIEPSVGEMDYRQFWAVIHPQMGLESVDRQIAEMRED